MYFKNRWATVSSYQQRLNRRIKKMTQFGTVTVVGGMLTKHSIKKQR